MNTLVRYVRTFIRVSFRIFEIRKIQGTTAMDEFSAPTPSPELLKQAEDLGKWIHEKTNNRRFPGSYRIRVSMSLLQHSMDIAEASTLLLRTSLPGPALALVRPLLESYMRGLWVLLCANDDSEIENFLEHKDHAEWSIKRLAAKLRKGAEEHYPWVELAISEIKVLHDLTHGGALHVKGRLTESAVEPNYQRAQLDALLERVIEVRIRIACEQFALLGDEHSIKSMNNLVSSFNRKPI